MLGQVTKFVIAVIFYSVLLSWAGFNVGKVLAPLGAVLIGLPLLCWYGWTLFKKGSEPSPHKEGEIGAVLIFLVAGFFLVRSVAMDLFGRADDVVTVVDVVYLLALVVLATPIARAGIERWERRQLGETGTKLYGAARFLSFDADLEWPTASKLNRPVGTGPFLGFYEANLMPTFFHRFMYALRNVRELWSVGRQGYRFRTLVYDGPSHLVTIAPARSGKGSCVIIPNLLKLERSVICIDPKGENAAVTRRHRASFGPVFLLNPFNEHGMGTSRFNPLAQLDIHDPHIVADVAGIAEALILAEGKEPFFTDSARDLVRAIILHLVAEKGGDATLGDVRRLLTLPSGDGENDEFGKLIFKMTESPHSFISQPASRFQNVDRTIQGIISTAIAQTGFLDDPAIAKVLSASDFDMRELKAKTATVYIILPSRYLTAYARFFRLLVVSALDQLTATPGGNRVTLILDEFAQLGHLSAIETAFGLAAGYNVQLWPFLQDLNQLKDIYKARWETFLANAGVIQWFAPNDMNTAEYLSRRLGNRTAPTSSTSKGNLWARLQLGFGSNTTMSETGVPLRTPQELMSMDKDIDPDPDIKGQILNVAGIAHPILCLRAPYDGIIFKMPVEFSKSTKYRELVTFHTTDWKPLFDPNPFHSSSDQSPDSSGKA